MKFILSITILFACNPDVDAQMYKKDNPLAHTYSIVARDPATGEMGVAVQSHWFSVGTAVSWAEAGVGAVATQSFTNKSFGIRGLALLKSGLTAQQALDSLLSDDGGRAVRQVAIVDANGNVAVHTGEGCIQFAGHIKGKQFSVQANMMLGDKVPAAMAAAYEKHRELPIAGRMLRALEAGQAAGGDIRGQQSAALLVVPGKSLGKPWDERIIDLRVDDHAAPVAELTRLYGVHLAYDHMNRGDLALEKNDMPVAMHEYNMAMKMMPDNLEMQYWTAITLANSKQVDAALPMLRKIFQQDANWKELTRRLPATGLITVSAGDLQKILSL